MKGSSPLWFSLRNLFRLAGVTLAVLYVFSRFVPAAAMSDYVVFDQVDNSWSMALHDAFVNRLQFGTDIVFTYGPWGFLARGYHPQTHLLSMIVWSLLALVFMSGAWQLARGVRASRLLAWLWVVLLAALATTPLGNDFDNRLVLFLALPLLLHFYTERTAPIKAALLVALGCLSLVKFTGLIEAAFVVALISADDIFRRHRFPWAVPLWAISVLCFWILAWQRLDGFGSYLVNSWQITCGYTEAMMLPGYSPPWSLPAFLALAAVLWLLASRLMWLQCRRWAFYPLAGVGMILFVTFKLGFVRGDFHELNASMSLVVMAALLLPLAWQESKILKVSVVLTLVAAGLFASGIYHDWPVTKGLPVQLAGTFRLSNVLAPVADASTGYTRTEYQREMSLIRVRIPLPPVNGGADLYSYDQVAIFANGLQYQPRPVIQSYSAYTPSLAQMNAAWLRSDRAATNLLFALQPLDHRFPSLDDGLSWPELLTRYAVNAETERGYDYLLLQRTATPRSYRLVELPDMSASLGESVTVPVVTNGLLWAELEFKKTPAGKIIAAAYKPEVLTMTVKFRDRPPATYRIIPGMTQAGFLLSPVVADNKSFAALFKSDWPAELAHREVQSLVVAPVTASGASLCYDSIYQLRFYRLEILQ
ncbi:MAG TPA: hypothetical protein VK815_11945 [Candidatus Acidoferrales bacterium]|jgi:hypothetical protein|nr:hypothetical protein [Candidatus Acidoferrales bacterium]